MKKALSFVLVICMLCGLFSGITVSAEEAAVDTEISYIFDIDTGTLTVTGSGEMDNYSWWNDFYPPWIGHKEDAKKVIINDGITSIGDYAFEDFIALKEIEIPESVKSIGMHSFSGSGLNEIDIHKNIEKISYMAFVNCDSMTSYNVAEENANYCSVDGVLFSKDMSVLKVYPLAKEEENNAYTIPDKVTEVEGYAFSRANNLGSVSFGANVKSIGDECFFNCENLTHVNFNEGLDFIGGGAFQHCKNISDVSLPSTITKIRPLAFYDTALYNDFTNWENNLLYIDEYLITGEYCITNENWEVTEEHYIEGSVVIKEGTVLIAGSAFSWFNFDPTITSVDFPASLKYINEYAFSFCEDITKIRLGGNVEWIDEGAFSYCSELAEITLGSNIKRINEGAFSETSYINNDTNYENGFLYEGNYLLGYTGTLPSEIEIKDGTTLIADAALSKGGTYSYQNFSVKIPESLKYIGKEAFLGTRTNTIEIPATVIEIGDYAIGFTGKTYDDSISDYTYSRISDTCIQGHADTAAESYAEKFGIEFLDVDAPEEITFGCYTGIIVDDTITITDFSWDSSYSPVVEIPYATSGYPITKIASGAFSDCSGLSSITIPETVTVIENNAFSSCADVVFYVTCGSVAHTYAENNALNYSAECVFPEVDDGIENVCTGCGKTQCEVSDHIMSGNECIRDGCDYSESGAEMPDIGEEDTTTRTEDRYTYTVSDGWATITDFDDTDAPAQLTIPSSLGGYTIIAIGDGAFSGSVALTEIVVPDGIETIGASAFSDCTNLEKISIPETVVSIDSAAFQMCPNVVICAPADSYAERYAANNSLNFNVKCDEHVYSNACDKDCNDCGAIRTVPAHSYSNSCDETCDVCGTARETTHKYENVVSAKATFTEDGTTCQKCSVCGYADSRSVAAVNHVKTVKLSTAVYTYNGKVKTPTVIVEDSAGNAISADNYTVTYSSGRKNVGKYAVTIEMKGSYFGIKTLDFIINPVKTKISKVTSAKKKLKVRVSKKSSQVTGYQIQYSTSKSFKSYKSKNIKNYKTTSVTLKKLSGKKTYYVRVRTYKTVGKVKYYSGWSTIKSKKTK